MMDELYVWINHVLNIYNYDSCIKMTFKMFRDHEMTLESIKLAGKRSFAQKGSKEAASHLPQAGSRFGTAQTREQAASRLPPSG